MFCIPFYFETKQTAPQSGSSIGEKETRTILADEDCLQDPKCFGGNLKIPPFDKSHSSR